MYFPSVLFTRFIFPLVLNCVWGQSELKCEITYGISFAVQALDLCSVQRNPLAIIQPCFSANSPSGLSCSDLKC